MRVVIHRGSHEIGGTCIEVSTDKTRILLDLGKPLDNRHVDPGFLENGKYDAIIVSHSHQDHYGLIERIDNNIPIYIGKLSLDLINAARVFLGKQALPGVYSHFKPWESFEVGDFTITPYLVDHSATDSYSLLVEAEGKRVLYSGDFRSHGRKSVLYSKMIQNPPCDIDLLFLEGTMIDRSNSEFPDENSVENKIVETIATQKNATFIITSSQNIDRLVSAYRACKRTGKIFVIDLYTAWVLEQMKQVSSSVPNMDWKDINVYFDFAQYKTIRRNADMFGRFLEISLGNRVLKDKILRTPEKYLMLMKMSKYRIIEYYKKYGIVNLIYSQWKGYLETEHAMYGNANIAEFQRDNMVNFIYAHTSGHAPLSELKKYAQAMNPRILVPVHTNNPEKFEKEFENVYEIMDGQVLVL